MTSGKEIGKRIGKKEGIKQTTNQFIIEMLKNNANDEFIKKVTGIHEQELQKIKDALACKHQN